MKQDILLLMIVIGVLVGFIIGASVNPSVNDIVDPESKATTLMLIGFPGELFMNMLKMLILPLIIASLICALATLDSKATGKIGRRTVLYYFTTTLLAVVLGIVLVISIRPGDWGDKGDTENEKISKPRRNLDSFLDLIRYLTFLSLATDYYISIIWKRKKMFFFSVCLYFQAPLKIQTATLENTELNERALILIFHFRAVQLIFRLCDLLR